MDFDTKIKPCPYCKEQMLLRKVSAPNGASKRQWFFFLYCNECGYGPLQAFDSGFEAVLHWNQNVIEPKKTSYPRWL